MLQAFHYEYYPEDLLEALDLMIAYLLPRKPVRECIETSNDARYNGIWRRAIYGGRGNTYWAYFLLNVNTRKKRFDGRTMWRLGARWRYRLNLAGIDPDTLEIVDQLRFNLCWEQLFEFQGKFYAEVQVQRIAQGRVAPAAVMRQDVKMKRIQGLPKPKRVKIADRVAKDAQSDSPYTTWMRDRIKSKIGT